MPRSGLIAVLLLSLLVVFGFAALSSSYENSGDRVDISEEFTPDPGNVTVLNGSNLAAASYDETVSVTYGQNFKKSAEEGSDYEWFTHNGTVKTIEGGELDGVGNAKIEYGYTVPSDSSTAIVELAGGLMEVLMLLLFVGVVIGVVAVVARLAQT